MSNLNLFSPRAFWWLRQILLPAASVPPLGGEEIDGLFDVFRRRDQEQLVSFVDDLIAPGD